VRARIYGVRVVRISGLGLMGHPFRFHEFIRSDPGSGFGRVRAGQVSVGHG
jgi:hypothetical protein